MADIARCWQEQGLVAGWVALDGDDTPRVFGSYLAAAFEQGGIALSRLDPDDGWSSAPAVHQIGILARAIELGWPFAVMVYRNVRVGEANETGPNTAGLTEDYIRVRLLSDLSLEDRASLLDLAVFDWIDTDLVDDVLGSSDARVRVAALPALDGLLVAVDRDHTVRRLHPLVRDACLDLLSVEDPTRKRFLHERIALALVRRGHLTPAWRHASETGDHRLVGQLMAPFGVVQLWLREGARRMISAGRFLTPEITAEYPRLELLRCILLCLAWRFDEAAALFEAVGRRTDRFTRDREGGDADALAVDSGVHASGAGGWRRAVAALRDRLLAAGRRASCRWR